MSQQQLREDQCECRQQKMANSTLTDRRNPCEHYFQQCEWTIENECRIRCTYL